MKRQHLIIWTTASKLHEQDRKNNKVHRKQHSWFHVLQGALSMGLLKISPLSHVKGWHGVCAWGGSLDATSPAAGEWVPERHYPKGGGSRGKAGGGAFPCSPLANVQRILMYYYTGGGGWLGAPGKAVTTLSSGALCAQRQDYLRVCKRLRGPVRGGGVGGREDPPCNHGPIQWKAGLGGGLFKGQGGGWGTHPFLPLQLGRGSNLNKLPCLFQSEGHVLPTSHMIRGCD